jgi:hypothetical protein
LNNLKKDLDGAQGPENEKEKKRRFFFLVFKEKKEKFEKNRVLIANILMSTKSQRAHSFKQ